MLHQPQPQLDLEELRERLRPAFLARYGLEMGAEVTAETMAYACEHLDELSAMNNPAGYLFRVGQSRSRRLIRWEREHLRLPAERPVSDTAWTEPALHDALATLGHEERTSVILVHCFQWTYAEVAELLDIEVTTVRNRLHRGLTRLRDYLGVDDD